MKIEIINWGSMPMAGFSIASANTRFQDNKGRIVDDPDHARAAAAPAIVHNLLEDLLKIMSQEAGFLSMFGLSYAQALIVTAASLPDELQHSHNKYLKLFNLDYSEVQPPSINLIFHGISGLGMAKNDIDGISHVPYIDLKSNRPIVLASIDLLRMSWEQSRLDISSFKLDQFGKIL